MQTICVYHRPGVAYRLRMRIHVDLGRAAAHHSATERQSDYGPTALQAVCCLKPYSIIAA